METVEAWLAEPKARYTDVVRKTMDEFGVSYRTATRYIASIYERWEEESAADRPARRAKMRTELQDCYENATQTATDAMGYSMSARILDQLAKLDGLYAPKDVRLSGSVGIEGKIRDMTPEQRAKRRAELERRRAAREAKEGTHAS